LPDGKEFRQDRLRCNDFEVREGHKDPCQSVLADSRRNLFYTRLKIFYSAWRWRNDRVF
jgi:hypothetical protein